jgi:WD40 repeat protein
MMIDEPSTNQAAASVKKAPFLADLLADQRASWERGERIPVEAYLLRHPALSKDAVLDLITNELLLRFELGERPHLREYAERFPQLTAQIKTQLEVELALAAEGGQTPATQIAPPTVRAAMESGTAEPATSLERSPLVLSPRQQLACLSLQIPGYEILAEIARGGQSVVYQARQVSLNRLVALKMMLAGAAADEEERARFRREAEAVAQLKHPHIVQIYDIGEQDGQLYFALEFVSGGTLIQQIRATPQPAMQAAQLLETLARTIHAAHQHDIVHRDLKPGNILLTPAVGEGTQPRHPYGTPKIADFGLAKRLHSDASLTQTGHIMGTPSYMAPEQAAGKNKDVGPPADIYSLGAILYELLTGRPPFIGEGTWDVVAQVLDAEPAPPRRLQPRVPRDLETICLKCLDKTPARRYASAALLADDLHRFQLGEPIQARPLGMLARGWRWCLRKPALALSGFLGGTTLIAIIVLAIVYFVADTLRVERNQTKDALAVAEKYRRRAEELSTHLSVARALHLREQSDTGRGMLWLAHALDRTETNTAISENAIRKALASWHHRIHPLRKVLLHDGEVFAAAFSLKGDTIVTCGANGTAQLWDAATGNRIGAPMNHDGRGRIYAVAFSSDGQTVATTSDDMTARLWHAGSGKLLGKPLPNQVTFVSGSGPTVAFSPTQDLVLTAGDGTRAQLWKIATGQPFGAPLVHRAPVCAVAFSPDGNTIATATKAGTTQLWSVATGRPMGSPLSQDQPVELVAFSPDSKFVLTEYQNHKARLWEVASGQRIGGELYHRNAFWAAAFSPDGTKVATTSSDGTARLWEIATGAPIGAPLSHRDRVCAVSFSPDSQMIVTGSFDGTAQIWDAATGRRLGPPLPHRDVVRSVAFGPDGKSVVTASRDGTVRLWQVNRTTPLETPLSHQGYAVYRALFSPDGKSVLTGSEDKTAALWDGATGKRNVILPHHGAVKCLAFSPDGTIVVTAGDDRTARLWHAATGKPLLEHPLQHDDFVRGVAFSPDGTILATVASNLDRTARFWDTRTGKLLGQPVRHDDLLSVVAFSPRADSNLVMTAGDDGKAHLWKTTDRSPAGTPLDHRQEIWAAAFSPNGQSLITAGGGKTARLWSVPDGKPLGQPLEHELGIRAVAFSPDGTLVATASHDKTARLWDAVTGAPVSNFLVHEGLVHDVAFSPNGNILATASADGTARLWDTGTGKLFHMPLRHEGPVLSVCFSPNGKTVLTASFDGNARLWQLPPPVQGEAKRLTRWVQVLTGMELDANGVVHILDGRTWHQRRQELAALPDPPLP